MWTCLLAFAGIALFLRGFFLNRRELGIRATFEEQERSVLARLLAANSSRDEAFSLRATHKHLVFVVIDGLRLDLLSLSQKDSLCGATPFNCFSLTHTLLRDRPRHSALFAFRADPPTTTSQRLRALATGSLPTFLELGSNLRSDAVRDDNLVDQLREHFHAHAESERGTRARREMAVLGDDTWLALFPSQFDAVRVHRSFDTRDLDGADEEVFRDLEQFFPANASETETERETASWRVLVAHFLSIDHVAHTHGVTTAAAAPLLAARLSRFDRVLSHVAQRLPRDSLLVLCGDHGLTHDGQHGGASEEELVAGLFLFSNRERPLRRERAREETKESVRAEIERELASPPSIAQIDLVPTLSLSLSVPVPFSSLGRVVKDLFPDDRANGTDGKQLTYMDALERNALQVQRFRERYFSSGDDGERDSLRRRVVRDITALPHMLDAENDYEALRLYCERTCEADEERDFCLATALHAKSILCAKKSCDEEALRSSAASFYESFLQKTQSKMRQEWTEFKESIILFGILLLFVSVVCHDDVWRAVSSSLFPFSELSIYVFPSLFGLFFLSCSVFSNSFVVAEQEIVYGAIQASLFAEVVFNVMRAPSPLPSNLKFRVVPLIIISVILRLLHHGKEWAPWITLSLCFAALLVVWSIAARTISSIVSFPTARDSMLSSFAALVSQHTQALAVLSCSSAASFTLFDCAFAAVPTQSATDPLSLSANMLAQRLALLCAALSMFFILLSISIDLLSRARSRFSTGGINDNKISRRVIVSLFFQLIAVLCTLFTVGAQNKLKLLLILPLGALYEFSASADAPEGDIFALAFHTFLSRFLFFATGHRMDFSALQLNAGFVGTNKFDLLYAAWALLMNTFCNELCYLPSILLNCINRRPWWSARIFSHVLLVRKIMLLCATVAAFVLRRHLMVWAIFAPKVLFEISMFVAFVLMVFLTKTSLYWTER